MRCALYFPLANDNNNNHPPYSEQKSKMINFVKSKGWTVSKEYRETSKKTPYGKYEEMKNDSFSRQFDFIIVYSICAFGRHPLAAITLMMNVFLPAGIGFYVLEKQYDSSAFSFDQNLEFLNEQKKQMIYKYRIEGLKAHRLSRNYNQYGYLFKETESGKILVVDDSVSDIIKSIFELFSNGVNRAEITRYLNNRKIPTPTQHFAELGLIKKEVKSQIWTTCMVSNIICNEIYSGIYTQHFLDESVSFDTPVFIDKDILEKVKEKLYQESLRPQINVGNRKPTPFLGILVDKGSGNKIVSYFRSKYENFSMRAVVGHNKGSKMFSDEKILYNDAVKEAERVLLEEFKIANKVKEYLKSIQGKKEIEFVIKQHEEKRSDLLREVILLNNIDTNRRIQQEEDKTDLSGQIVSLDRQINEMENYLKQLNIALSDKNPWIILFTQECFIDDIKSKNYKKYVERFDCVNFSKFELTPLKKEWKEMIPADWRRE